MKRESSWFYYFIISVVAIAIRCQSPLDLLMPRPSPVRISLTAASMDNLGKEKPPHHMDCLFPILPLQGYLVLFKYRSN